MAGRRTAFRRGAWELARERCRIADTRPPPPLNAAAIGEIIPRLVKRLGLESEHWQHVLQSEWLELVGGPVAAHARPGPCEDGRLTIYVDSPVWLQEISACRRELAANLQRRFGRTRIRAVNLHLDPDAGAPRPGR